MAKYHVERDNKVEEEDKSGCKLVFSKEQFAGLIFLPVILNGRRIIAFFDTGAGMTFIRSSLAKEMGLKEQSQLRGGNNQRKEMDFRTVEVGSLVLGQERMENLSAGVVPDESMDFGHDSEGNAFPADLILGWDVIGNVRFAFDMRKREVLVKPGGGSPQEDSLKWDRFPKIQIDYQGEKYPMGFDTGHTETMLDDSWLNRIQGLHSSSTVVQGIGSRSEEEVHIADRLTFFVYGQEVTLEHIEIMNYEIPGSVQGSISGLLGIDLVKGKRWTMDGKSRHFQILD